VNTTKRSGESEGGRQQAEQGADQVQTARHQHVEAARLGKVRVAAAQPGAHHRDAGRHQRHALVVVAVRALDQRQPGLPVQLAALRARLGRRARAAQVCNRPPDLLRALALGSEHPATPRPPPTTAKSAPRWAGRWRR